MEIRFSERLNSILGYAREEAMRTGCYAITVDHLILGILRDGDNDACRALAGLGIDIIGLKHFIDSEISRDKIVPFGDGCRISVSRGAENAINMAALEALKSNQTEVSPAHLLLAATRISGGAGQSYFERNGLTTGQIGDYMRANGMLLNQVRKVTPSPEEITHLIKISNIGGLKFS